MSKYIIKNCTSLDSDGTTCQDCSYEDCGADDCINRTDCVMKQIVELCRKELNSLETYVDIRSHECITLQNVLKLLDIQEVE